MKKLFIYFCLLIVVVIASSCNNFLTEDPKGSLTSDVLYSSGQTLDMAVSGIYGQFQNSVAHTELQLYMWCGDDVTSQNAGNKIRFATYDRFYYDSGNNDLYQAWMAYYTTIKACNSVINGAADMDIDPTFLQNRLGIAYFFRALEYFYLVRIWGPVPMPTTTDIDYTTQRSPVEDVYAQIESDIAKAEEYLPDNWTVTPYFNYGLNVAPNTGAAKALEASVWMTEAGWPLNKGPEYYDKAAAKYKEIIDNAAMYNYSLEPNIRNLVTEAGGDYNHEIVFGGFMSQWQFASSYNEFPEECGGWCDLLPELDFFNHFPEGARKDAYFFTTICLANGTMVPWDDPSTNQRHPHFKKNVDSSIGWQYNYDTKVYTGDGMNWGQSGKTRYLFRYADILLLYAEAVAYGSGTIDGNVVDYVNQVKARAGEADSLKVTTGMSKTDFQQAVLDERKWETCGNENSVMGRFFTMQRHGILQNQSSYRITDGDIHDTTLNPAFVSQTSPSEQFYYFPIPDQEMLIVPDLK